jgi:hypothetical protein
MFEQSETHCFVSYFFELTIADAIKNQSFLLLNIGHVPLPIADAIKNQSVLLLNSC